MISNKHTEKYWTDENLKALQQVESFKELLTIWNKIFDRMPNGFIQVCGPIASGGLGSVEENLKVFDGTIRTLQQEGNIVFDQIPFEKPMQELKKKVSDGAKTVLEDFYLPIFESGKIGQCYFIKGWETSVGANWEHDQAKRLDITIVYQN